MDWISTHDSSQEPENGDILLIQIKGTVISNPEYAVALYNKDKPEKYLPINAGRAFKGEVVAWMRIMPYLED